MTTDSVIETMELNNMRGTDVLVKAHLTEGNYRTEFGDEVYVVATIKKRTHEEGGWMEVHWESHQ